MRGGHFFLTNTVDVVSQGVTEIFCGFPCVFLTSKITKDYLLIRHCGMNCMVQFQRFNKDHKNEISFSIALN